VLRPIKPLCADSLESLLNMTVSNHSFGVVWRSG
jgi:hypothetical protein